jgi:hypothetical protein
MTRHHQISFALPQLKMKWLILFFLVSSSDWIYCPHRRSGSGCQALSSSTSAPTSTSTSTSYSSTPLVSAYSTLTLTSLGKSQLAVLDGAEWNSVQSILKDQQKQDKSSSSSSSTISSTKYGYMKIVTGKDEENRRIVAMQCMDTDDNNNKRNDIVYEDSLAVIPQKVSDVDAISTYIASFSSIHCALPIIEEENVGGRKAVVLGSSDLACFSAEGLACMGMDVFMVNNKGNANVRKNIGKCKYSMYCIQLNIIFKSQKSNRRPKLLLCIILHYIIVYICLVSSTSKWNFQYKNKGTHNVFLISYFRYFFKK